MSQSGRSEVTAAASDSDSDSDNFSVEFEVESIASDDYNEDDASLSADDQVTSCWSPGNVYSEHIPWKEPDQRHCCSLIAERTHGIIHLCTEIQI